jgi:hypothetical protein
LKSRKEARYNGSPSRNGTTFMSLPVVFSKSNLPRFITDSPLRAAAVAVPVAVVGFWLLPFWVTGGALAFGGWQIWKRLG